MESIHCMDTKARSMKLIATKMELDEFCRENGYTNDSLAFELNVSRATVFNWKASVEGLPRLVSLALFALQCDQKIRKVGAPGRKDLRKRKWRGSDEPEVSPIPSTK